MAELKPFQVEVTVQAPPAQVWAALTDPAEIRRWHGWDYDGLDAEIEFIYVEHAEPHPPDRIDLVEGADGQTIELVPNGGTTVVRITRPGPRADDDGRYDEIEEGWRSFFQQMRHYLERHPGEERRTLFLDGRAVASAVSVALVEKLPGQPWFEDTFQRGVATDDYGGGLVVLATREPLDSERLDAVHVTVTTHGLADEAFAAVRDDWWSWWSARVEAPEATTG